MNFMKNNCNHMNCRQQDGTAPQAWRIPKLLLCALLSVSLAACSSQGTQNLSGDSSKTQDSANGGSKADESQDNPEAQDNAQSDSKSQDNANGNPKADNAQSDSKTQEEPVLEAGASDEELLEVLKDDIHVVTEEEFHDTATGILERTAEYTGQIYQLEGVLKMDGTALCLAHDAEEDSPLLPLKYLKPDFKEGDKVRITGIASQDTESDDAAVLEVVVAEAL
ncbi:MAG: hypothetical protein HFH38_11745 [Lachnospiraceae bacterium]|nr:hypothetical protein [Lachnospiraceae bacterium]